MKIDQNLINKAVDLFVNWLNKKSEPAPVPAPAQAAPVNAESSPKVSENPPAIDWSRTDSKISKHFSVGEATHLESWNAYHQPSEDEKAAIAGVAPKIEKALDIVAKETGKEVHVNVHAWIRPEHANIPGHPHNGEDYNRYIYETQVWNNLSPEERAKKVVPASPHRTGHAVDFHVIGFEGRDGCAKIRAMLLPHLEELGLRMENLNGGWVHLDDKPVPEGGHRFFKP